MLNISIAHLPALSGAFLQGLAKHWLTLLEGRLSAAQKFHARRFRQPDQKCLHLLCRLMALKRADKSAILDMDSAFRPFFPHFPLYAVSFCYAGKHAFCAFYKAEKGVAPAIAIDAVSLTSSDAEKKALAAWFMKFIPEKKNIQHLDIAFLQKLWLLQECFTKLHSLPLALRKISDLMPLTQNENEIISLSGTFYAQFMRKNAFLICIAASEKIFPTPCGIG